MDITSLLHAALLGLIEGLTEFIPVSSTGHLIVVSKLLAFDEVPGKVFEVFIQLGAIMAVVWHYRRKLTQVVTHLHTAPAQDFVAKLMVATLPAGVVGALWHQSIKTHLFTIEVVAWMLVIGGFAILLIERKARTPAYTSLESMPYRKILLVGCIQALALVPGISRSGATIMGALVLGADRKTAAEFSFFLAIPAITAAALFDVWSHYKSFSAHDIGLLMIGFTTAFLSALMVIRWLLHFVSNHTFASFAWYRIIVGCGLLVWLAY